MKERPAHGGSDLAEVPAQGQVIDPGTRRAGFAWVEWRDRYGWFDAGALGSPVPAKETEGAAG